MTRLPTTRTHSNENANPRRWSRGGRECEAERREPLLDDGHGVSIAEIVDGRLLHETGAGSAHCASVLPGERRPVRRALPEKGVTALRRLRRP